MPGKIQKTTHCPSLGSKHLIDKAIHYVLKSTRYELSVGWSIRLRIYRCARGISLRRRQKLGMCGTEFNVPLSSGYAFVTLDGSTFWMLRSGNNIDGSRAGCYVVRLKRYKGGGGSRPKTFARKLATHRCGGIFSVYSRYAAIPMLSLKR